MMFGWTNTDYQGNPTNMGMGLKMAVWAGAEPDFSAASVMTHSFGGALGCDPFPAGQQERRALLQRGRARPPAVAGYHPSARAEDLPDLRLQVSRAGAHHAHRPRLLLEDRRRCGDRALGQLHRAYRLAHARGGDRGRHRDLRQPSRSSPRRWASRPTTSRPPSNATMSWPSRAVTTTSASAPTACTPSSSRRSTPPRSATSSRSAWCTASWPTRAATPSTRASSRSRACTSAVTRWGCRFAEDYPTTIMGVSHGMAMTFGRLAGINAAQGN